MNKEKVFYILLSIFFIIGIFLLFKIIPFASVKIINTLLIAGFLIYLLFSDKKNFITNLFIYSVVFISVCYFVEHLFLDNLYDYLLILAFTILVYKIIKKEFNLKEYIKSNFNDNTYKYLFIFLIFWLIYSLIFLFFVKYKNIALGKIQFILYAFILFICYNYLFYLKKFNLIINSFFILGLFLVISSFFEIFFHIHYPTFKYHSRISEPLLTGITGLVNDYATNLFIFSFFILVFINKKIKKDLLNILSIFLVSLIFFFLLIYTESRANIIGLIIFFIFSILIYIFSMLYKIKNKFYFFLILSLFIIIITLSLIVLIKTYKYQMMNYLGLKKNIGFSELLENRKIHLSSLMVRIRLILNSMLMLKDAHFLGVGPGIGQELMPIYSNNYYYTGAIRSIHSLWIELLTDYGVITFILFMIFFFSLLILFIKNFYINKDKIKKDINIINILSFSTLMGFIISSNSISSIVTRPIVWIYFFFVYFVSRDYYD